MTRPAPEWGAAPRRFLTVRRSASEDADWRLASDRNGRSARVREEGEIGGVERRDGSRRSNRDGARKPDGALGRRRGPGRRRDEPDAAGVVVVGAAPPLEVGPEAVPRRVPMGVLVRLEA